MNDYKFNKQRFSYLNNKDYCNNCNFFFLNFFIIFLVKYKYNLITSKFFSKDKINLKFKIKNKSKSLIFFKTSKNKVFNIIKIKVNINKN